MASQTAGKDTSLGRTFFSYVFPNILGMIGISAYILADTFFISVAEGANGLTALNLVLPVYSIIFAIGNMIAVGSATRFRIFKAQGNDEADHYFTNAILFCLLFSIPFLLVGLFFSKGLVMLLGADAVITSLAAPYSRIFMLFTPFFMWNYVANAFVRNDNAPKVAMTATLVSSLFNIVMDYVLMFPLHMGMRGAALATAISPIIGIIICAIHILSKKSAIRFVRTRPSLIRLFRSCQLGVAAMIGELAQGVTTLSFNFLILSITGNVGVAAYGVIANIAFVGNAIFNGLSQGSQPLFSYYYGKKRTGDVGRLLRLTIITGLVLAVLVILATNLFAGPLVAIFNSENNPAMANLAVAGMHLYFIGYLFAAVNIVACGYLGATEAATWSFVTSLSRGLIAILIFAFILSKLFAMTGIWLAFPAAEAVTLILSVIAMVHWRKHIQTISGTDRPAS